MSNYFWEKSKKNVKWKNKLKQWKREREKIKKTQQNRLRV
jgi:hypothetical protein